MKAIYGVLTYRVENENGVQQVKTTQAMRFLNPNETSREAHDRMQVEEAGRYPDGWSCFEEGWETREVTLDFCTPDMVLWMQDKKTLSVKTILAIDFALPHVIALVAEYGEELNDIVRKHSDGSGS